MRFGFQLMLRGPAASGEGLSSIVEQGEANGFDVVAPNDHIVVPNGIESHYPYTEDGVWPGAVVGECHEQLTALAYISGRTERIKLLTSVMVVPYRAPVLTAKIIATADVLSEGRLIVGVGAGWMAEEFQAVGAPEFLKRGKVTDEYLRIFSILWGSSNLKYEGEFAGFSDILFEPRPVQKPHPPIWIGGESKAALRRVARLGDGWYPVANNPKYRIANPDDLKARLNILREICDEEGRDFGELDIAFFYTGPVVPKEQRHEQGRRMLMTGSPADIAEDISKFEAVGLGTMVMIFQRPELAQTLEEMEWFSSEVMPLAQS